MYRLATNGEQTDRKH